jgi:SAM-dependent methyltransferase
VTDYLLMFRRNGIGRLIKTAGRRMLLVDRTRRNAWARAVGTTRFRDPTMMQGNVCADPLPQEAFDLAMSWSVFEHLCDPTAAMRNVWRALRPGGVFYIGIHLYTATNGHHDFRHSATGDGALPPLGDHDVDALTQLALRGILDDLVPEYKGVTLDDSAVGELLDKSADRPWKGLLTSELRAELLPYHDEELVSVDAFYVGKKPATG